MMTLVAEAAVELLAEPSIVVALVSKFEIGVSLAVAIVIINGAVAASELIVVT